MTDENAPHRKGLRAAHEHLRAIADRREEALALVAEHLAERNQPPPPAPADPDQEATP